MLKLFTKLPTPGSSHFVSQSTTSNSIHNWRLPRSL